MKAYELQNELNNKLKEIENKEQIIDSTQNELNSKIKVSNNNKNFKKIQKFSFKKYFFKLIIFTILIFFYN